MAADQDKLLSPTMLKARNKILVEYADLSFSDALDEVKLSLKSEKNNSTRLALLAAKSWIIRNKVYAMMNEPFVYSLNELENTKIFSEAGDDDDVGVDNLFDDDDDDDDNTDGNIEVSILKATTHNGVKFMKDMLIKVSQEDADKLVSEKKAKYIK
ncbi:hypothetical protein OAH73_01375 [Planktomarina sp.]|nr:hypothetical protein [Planktomarina sp.]MDB4841224.1 hypothetical protein [Planktomarina sp.]